MELPWSRGANRTPRAGRDTVYGMAASRNQPTEALDRETLVVAGVVMLGAVMSILDTTVVNVAIDRLATDFNSSLTTN